jgi:hypothetical protein
MNKFTPGPWETSGLYVYGIDKKSHGRIVADCTLDNGSGPYRQVEQDVAVANLRLIAAAPDLFNACQQVMDMIDNMDEDCFSENFEGFDENAMNQLREVIKRVMP